MNCEERQINNHKWNVVSAVVLAFATHLVNAYFAKYALRLGGGEMEMAYLHSLPAAFGMISLIPGAILIDAIGRQKATSWFMFAHKIFYLLMAAVPFLPDSAPKPLIFVLLVAAMNLPGAIYTNGFNSSLGDAFAIRERSRALAHRNKFSEITRIVVTIISGLVMTLPQTDDDVIKLYQVYFVIAFAVGLLEVFAYKKFVFPSGETSSETHRFHIGEFTDSLKSSAKFAFTNGRFVLFMVLSMFFYIGWHYGWPLFSVFTVQKLGATEGYLAIYSVAAAIASVAATNFWVWLSKRIPASKSIIYATAGMSITPFTYIIFNTLELQIICYAFSGFFILGTTMNLLLMTLEITPTANRTTIMSIHATLIAVSQTILPIISVQILKITNIEISLAITGILRFLGCFTLLIFYLLTRGRSANIYE